MEKDAFYNITRKEKVQIESAMNPLIITDAKEPDFQFYDISSPFVVMLETCRESDNNCHIYQFSPDNYHNIELGLSSNFALTPRPQHQHSCIEFMYGETSVYRDSCPDHDFNCSTDHIGSSSGNTVLNRIRRESWTCRTFDE